MTDKPSLLDQLRAEGDAKMRGIRAPRGEGNGYNMKGGGKKLQARIEDAKKKGKRDG